MNYHNINKHDVANGEGIRVSLFVSGCSRKCPGCFNEQTWNPDSGELFTQKQIDEIIEYSKPEYISGLSLLGGEPFEPYNQSELIKLLKIFKDKYPQKDVWCWTGFRYEELIRSKSQLLDYIDVLIDGPFDSNKKDLKLKWRGSSNQRIIRLNNKI